MHRVPAPQNRGFWAASPDSTFHIPSASQKWNLRFWRKNAIFGHALGIASPIAAFLALAAIPQNRWAFLREELRLPNPMHRGLMRMIWAGAPENAVFCPHRPASDGLNWLCSYDIPRPTPPGPAGQIGFVWRVCPTSGRPRPARRNRTPPRCPASGNWLWFLHLTPRTSNFSQLALFVHAGQGGGRRGNAENGGRRAEDGQRQAIGRRADRELSTGNCFSTANHAKDAKKQAQRP